VLPPPDFDALTEELASTELYLHKLRQDFIDAISAVSSIRARIDSTQIDGVRRRNLQAELKEVLAKARQCELALQRYEHQAATIGEQLADQH
jgi:hypothetical protein